jgi:ribosomal protein L40E
MSNISKVEFSVLKISGSNYSSWALDAELHLESMGLADTIKDENKESNQNRAKALIFLRHHLDEGLKLQYLTLKDPLKLWKNLKERYDHLKLVVLPQARHDWLNLRLLDFKNITEYNSAMFRIISQLNLCGEEVTEQDKLEKTYSTFPPASTILQQQYRSMGFTRYSELLSHLLIAERHNELLIKNHDSRPVGSSPLPEINQANYNRRERNNGPRRGRGRGRGQRRNHDSRIAPRYDQEFKKKEKKPETSQRRNSEIICQKCGGRGHWTNNCRSSKRFVQLYQASLKRPENPETNFLSEDNIEPMHLEVADYLNFPEENLYINENMRNLNIKDNSDKSDDM